jgi:acetylornithine aminotransferase
MTISRSPVLEELGVYPFAWIEQEKRRVAASGVPIYDFGLGDPREPTAPIIREALVDGLRETMGYPKAAGLPELRASIARWLARRFGVELDPEREIVPTYGAKEAIFGLAQIVVDRPGGRDLVVVTEPGYPVAERGARFAGADVLALPLREANAFLPDLDQVPDSVWRRAAVVWVNYPNNPTGATAPRALFESLASLAEQHGFLLASDEAYTELWFDQPPGSALQVKRRTNVVAVQSLSKRSSMTGFRSGFVAGSADAIDALKLFRPSVGTAPQEFVQRASIAAWADERHVAEARERYARKRELLVGALEGRGLRVAGGDATMYLWVAVPPGESSASFAARLLAAGIVVTPGVALGPSGEGFVRFALVPTEDECRDAVTTLEEVL